MSIVNRQDHHAIARSARLYITANVLGHAYLIITLPILSGHLSSTEFGSYTILIQMVTVLQAVVLTLFSQSMVKLSSEYNGIRRSEFLGTVVWSVILLISGFTWLLYTARDYVLPRLYPNISNLSDGDVGRACLLAVVASARTLTLTKVKLDERPLLALQMNLVYGLGLACLLGAFIRFEWSGLRSVLNSIVGAELIATVLVGARCWRDITPVWRLDLFVRSIRFAAPLALGSLFFLLSSNVDRKVLSEYVGLDEIGGYGIGLIMGNSLSLITSSYAPAFTARALKVWKRNGPADMGALVREGVVDSCSVTAFAWIGLVVACPLGVIILNRGGLPGPICGIAAGIGAGHFMRGAFLFAQNLLFVAGKTRHILLLNVTLLILSWGVAHILARCFGGMGVAFSGSLAYAILLPVVVFFARDYGAKSFPWKMFIRFVVGMAVIGILEFCRIPSCGIHLIEVGARIGFQSLVAVWMFRSVVSRLLPWRTFRQSSGNKLHL